MLFLSLAGFHGVQWLGDPMWNRISIQTVLPAVAMTGSLVCPFRPGRDLRCTARGTGLQSLLLPAVFPQAVGLCVNLDPIPVPGYALWILKAVFLVGRGPARPDPLRTSRVRFTRALCRVSGQADLRTLRTGPAISCPYVRQCNVCFSDLAPGSLTEGRSSVWRAVDHCVARCRRRCLSGVYFRV